jgi:hypothetical protein|tara:strand:+ start:401 stop:568 length:168 start_codon:yes stop_codon:yes gene_type:complete
MTVKELIKELKSYNPQARVIINGGSSDLDDYSYLYRIGWSYDNDGKTNKDLVKLA